LENWRQIGELVNWSIGEFANSPTHQFLCCAIFGSPVAEICGRLEKAH
jgi:hypothetical protein